jgi:hypothetical protein
LLKEGASIEAEGTERFVLGFVGVIALACRKKLGCPTFPLCETWGIFFSETLPQAGEVLCDQALDEAICPICKEPVSTYNAWSMRARA